MAARKRKKQAKFVRWSILLSLLLFLVLFRLVEEVDQDQPPEARFEVVKVIDGDSVELRGGDRLRLLAVDTPEKGEFLYDSARSFLSHLAIGKTARIEFGNKRRDRYGRLLGYLYIDSILVNEAILRNGLGYLYLFKNGEASSDEVKLMLQAQRSAMQEKVGLWSINHEQEAFYLNPPGSFRLHRPGCRSLTGKDKSRYQRFELRSDGLYDGLSPCRNCKP